MSYPIYSQRKCCATCAYYSGERELTNLNRQVNIPSDKIYGKCVHPTYPGSMVQFGFGCPRYEKWQLLR